MTNTALKNLGLSLFFILLLGSCQKETITETANDEILSTSSLDENKGGCRLTRYEYYDFIHDYSQVDAYTYKNGLIDEWSTSWGAIFKLKYDHKGKLKTALGFIDGELVTTIKFIYKDNKISKEIWYVGETDVIDDQVVYTFNNRGQMIKNESLNYFYKVYYTYFHDGETKSWKYFEDDVPVQLAEYTYYKDYKNPIKTVSGLEHLFAYANSGFFTGKKWYSSEKITLYDENGIPFIYYDLDPRRTTWDIRNRNLPNLATYVDKETQGIVTNNFVYENCSGPHKNSDALSGSGTFKNNKAIVPGFKTLKGGPTRKMTQELLQARKMNTGDLKQ